MSSFKTKFDILINHLQNPNPKGIFHVGYVFGSSNPGIQLHKRVFIAGFTKQRPIFIFFNIYGWLIWYLGLGWFRLIKAWLRNRQRLWLENQIDKIQHFRDLLNLSIGHGIHPRFYYRFRLYQYPRNEWMRFIYDQELPTWHQLFSPQISQRSHRLLRDKHYFAQAMEKEGLSTIQGLTILKGEQITANHLFNKSTRFIKPVIGSAQRDNFTLNFAEKTASYTLEDRHGLRLNDHTDILNHLNRQFQKQSFLIQAFCKNHPDLQSALRSQDLITIRFITMYRKEGVELVSALLEIPTETNSKHYCILPIDIHTGILNFNPLDSIYKEIQTIDLKKLSEFPLPLWDEVCVQVRNAHQQMPDVFSVGWDLAITDDGVKLIEGNFNWSVIQHQLDGPRLLESFKK